ncbi:hypothetical protein IAS59_005059 [Cryptococcus gattii]
MFVGDPTAESPFKCQPIPDLLPGTVDASRLDGRPIQIIRFVQYSIISNSLDISRYACFDLDNPVIHVRKDLSQDNMICPTIPLQPNILSEDPHATSFPAQ